MPVIEISMMAVLIAMVAHFVLGFVWYTPLFGKAWAKEMGFDINEKPAAGIMIRGMVFMLIGNFFLAYVLSHNMAAWNPATWGWVATEGVESMPAMSAAGNAAMAAIFTWLGFFLPIDLNAVAWEKKSWKLFAINTSYHFLSLLLVAMILAHM